MKQESAITSNASSTQPVETIESTMPEPVVPSYSTSATPPPVDTSGLILVDKAWMEAMEMSIKGLSAQIQQNNNGGQPQNGAAAGWKGIVESLARAVGEIIAKIPNQQADSFGETAKSLVLQNMSLVNQTLARNIGGQASPGAAPPA